MDRFLINASVNARFVSKSLDSPKKVTTFRAAAAGLGTSFNFSVPRTAYTTKNSPKRPQLSDAYNDRFLQILNSPLDQPIFNDQNNVQSSSASAAPTLLSMSSKTTSSFDHTDENMPPSNFIAHHDEGYYFNSILFVELIVCVAVHLLRCSKINLF